MYGISLYYEKNIIVVFEKKKENIILNQTWDKP